MIRQGTAPHESIELHELLAFKNVSLTKCITMSKLVSDDELKAILQQDAVIGQQHIRELSSLLEQSVFLKTDVTERPICIEGTNQC